MHVIVDGQRERSNNRLTGMATLEEFKSFYQDNSAYFEKASEGVTNDAISPPHRHVHTYVQGLTGKVVGDFGCGSGRDIEQMYNARNAYVGLDVSEGALTNAKQRFAPSNVTYLQIDFEKPIELPDASFDVITSFFVYEHVLKPTQTLDEMMRLLKPKGELWIITPNYGSPLKSAPPFGTPSKKKLVFKSFNTVKTMFRRILFPQASLDLTMIPLQKIDISSTWGPDMDATNEPWAWEIASYVRNHGLSVSTSSWEEGTKADLKTGPERMLWRWRKLPLVKHFGPLCVIHATKR